jgi:starch synthase
VLWFERPREFRALMRNSMRADNSWKQPGQHYLNVYNQIRTA